MEEKSLADANIANSERSVSEDTTKVESNQQQKETSTEPQKEPSKSSEKKALENKQEDKAISSTANREQTQSSPNVRRVERRKIDISKFGRKMRSALRFISPKFISSKLKYYYSEYKRILLLSRKPTPKEFKELTIMVAIGTLIVGVIGFFVQLIIQFI
ncbi:MAG: protein translocase SEC61 complex subunit gamma [Candidatus Acidifodinimicrobium sp.]